MAFDAHKNFAYSTVLTPPSPATTGTSLVLSAGGGALMPAAPFNAVVWPAGSSPLSTNAEIVRVTAISTDTLTITRAQEGSTARTIVAGDQVAEAITAKALTDIEAGLPTTKGDLAGYSTTNARIPVGADTQVLTADSTQALGVKWAAPAGGGQTTVTKVVAPSGGDYTTLGAALAAAATGWIIKVMPGTYNEAADITITSTVTNITIIGSGNRTSIINMAAHSFTSSANLTLRDIGMDFSTGIFYGAAAMISATGCYFTVSNSGGLRFDGIQAQVTGNYFSHAGTGLIRVNGIRALFSSNIMEFTGAWSSVGPFTATGAQHAQIIGNTFYSPNNLGTCFGDAMVAITGAQWVTFAGNNITGTATNCGGLILNGSTYDTVVSGNVINGTTQGINIATGSTSNIIIGNSARGQGILDNGTTTTLSANIS